MNSVATKKSIIKVLVNNFELSKIILFGSQANGTARKDSDVDLLVISDSTTDTLSSMTAMRKTLLEIDFAFDVIVMNSKQYKRDLKYPGTVARYATLEGQLLYEQ